MEIINDRLKENPAEKIFKNPAAPLNIGGRIDLKYLVIHYTATDTAKSAINTFKDPTNKNRPSAHIVLDKDGTITQMVDFNLRANHAGSSNWDGATGFNENSIGIEVVNAGFAEKLTDGSFRRSTGIANPKFQTWPAGTEAIKIDHKHNFHSGKEMHFWFAYPQAQLDVLFKLSKLLIEKYNLKVIGHDDISAGRKLDPGPAFPWEKFKMAVLGQTDSIGKIFRINTANTELKNGPSATAGLIKRLPEKFEIGLIKTEGELSKVYLVNSVPDVKKIVNGKERSIKTEGWVLSASLTLKEGQ